mmetsp:Transcript_32707/g.73494  ORF Transcript_32707/g.73494 Transcript_32707/m.73494 type:complete len:407 (-) Transcript_32707:119-1339(-)
MDEQRGFQTLYDLGTKPTKSGAIGNISVQTASGRPAAAAAGGVGVGVGGWIGESSVRRGRSVSTEGEFEVGGSSRGHLSARTDASRIASSISSVWKVLRASWRVLLLFSFLSFLTPVMLFTSPLTISFTQFLLGWGLAAATWVIVKYPTDKAQERMASDRVQPEMHLVLGTLLPELAVNLEKLLLWLDLAMRGRKLPTYLRYPVLNLVAYITGPLWFALLIMAMVFFLLVISVISFGLMIPWVAPILGLLLGYAMLVPVWVVSVYMLSLLPLLISTFVGSMAEIYLAHAEYRKQYRARKMIRPEVQGSGQALTRTGACSTSSLQESSSPAAAGVQRNPSQGGQPWLSKMELLRLYQQRGLLLPLPTLSPPPGASAPHTSSGSGAAQASQGSSASSRCCLLTRPGAS